MTTQTTTLKTKAPLTMNSEYKYSTVLLIDDNDLDNFINDQLLQSDRFAKNILTNTSAKSALEFFNNIIILGESCPEVVFIDINMPVLDGFQFIDLFKKTIENRLRQQPKLVVLTSSMFGEDRQKVHSLSEEIVFLNKPLTKEMLDRI